MANVVPIAAELLLLSHFIRNTSPENLPRDSVADNLKILSDATRLMEIQMGVLLGLMTTEEAQAETTILMRAAEPQNQQIAGVVQ
jgi:hypothetical protein